MLFDLEQTWSSTFDMSCWSKEIFFTHNMYVKRDDCYSLGVQNLSPLGNRILRSSRDNRTLIILWVIEIKELLKFRNSCPWRSHPNIFIPLQISFLDHNNFWYFWNKLISYKKFLLYPWEPSSSRPLQILLIIKIPNSTDFPFCVMTNNVHMN